MTILYAIVCIMAIIFMSLFIFMGIWLFVVALKAYKQLRYKNYILEKIYQSIDNTFNTNKSSEEIENLLDFDTDLDFDNEKVKGLYKKKN